MKARRRVTICIGASAALLIVIIAVPSRKGEDVAVAAPAAAPAPLPAAAAVGRVATEEQLRARRERSAKLTWGKDPFWPQVDVQPRHELPGLRLNGISSFDGVHMALIDHDIVSEGDRLASGHEVGEITDKTVTLHRDQEHRILTLGGLR